MNYKILVRSQPSGKYIATALTLPGIMTEATSRADALEQMRYRIFDLLTKGEIVELDVAEPKSVNAALYQETFGMFQNDPTFSQFIEEMEKYRQERNQMED